MECIYGTLEAEEVCFYWHWSTVTVASDMLYNWTINQRSHDMQRACSWQILQATSLPSQHQRAVVVYFFGVLSICMQVLSGQSFISLFGSSPSSWFISARVTRNIAGMSWTNSSWWTRITHWARTICKMMLLKGTWDPVWIGGWAGSRVTGTVALLWWEHA